MSYFEILLLALLIAYIVVGFGLLMWSTRSQKRFAKDLFVTRRSNRRMVAKGGRFEVALNARAEGHQRREVQPLRIVLVVDRSSSMMSEKVAGSPLHIAVRSVIEFARQLDLTRHRIGLVQFDTSAEILCELTGSAPLVAAAAKRIRGGGGTDALPGIEDAAALLGYSDTESASGIDGTNRDVVILLTDGETYNEDKIAKLCESLKTKNGLRIITIGLGSEVNSDFLASIASPSPGSSDESGPAEYHQVLDVSQLVSVYRSLAVQIAASVGGGGTLEETISRRKFTYVGFGEDHEPVKHLSEDGTVQWIFPAINEAPQEVRYYIKGNRVGWHRIVERSASLDYFSIPDNVHHRYDPRLPKYGQAEDDKEVHEERCRSNRNPHILVTPRFGPAILWAIFLNPLFWILWSAFSRLHKRRSGKAVSESESSLTPPPLKQPKPMKLVPPQALECPPLRPTMVVGLGKSGRHVLSAYKAMIADTCGGTYPSDKIKLLQIDTDIRTDDREFDFAGSSLTDDESADLSADVFELHQRLLVKKEPHLRWYIASRLAGLPREVFNTAGGVHRVRQVARLALFQHLNDPEAVIRQRLQSAIEFLSEFLLDGKTAQVFIVGSSSGGTGSAIAHDLAYLIRRGLQLRLPKGREHAQTIGFFLGNTCFAPHSRNIATYQKNSRSLLEEAGRFMTNTELPLMIDYGTAVSDITGCPEGTGPVASDSTENAASAPGSIYDQVYVVDPAPEGYRDSAGMTGTVVAEDGHYPALADILSHYSLEDTGFQKFIAKSIWERNADRTVKEQKGHISNINARAVRFPIGLTSTWLAHRFVHEWFIGRSLWAEQIAGEFVPAQDLPKDGLSLDSLLRDDNLGPSSDPPMLFDILDELAEDLRSGWDRNWSTAFRRIQVNEGVDYGRDYVRKQSKIAFFSVLSWMLRSLNDSGHDDSQEINGALPKTINRLTEFRDLTEKAALNLSRLPIGNLTETGAESFLHWKARIVEELLDSYYQVADTCLRITRRWYRCLLGVSPENEKNREAGVCQRIAHSLRSDENDLSFLKTIRSVKYQTDELFRDDLYNRYLKPYLDNGGFRSRLRWQLDALALKQLSAGMSSGAGSFGTDRINARILKLAVLVDDEQPPVEFSDPVKDAEGICQALSDVAKKLNQAYEYCRAFADNGADDRREHLSRTDLIIQATPEGGATFDRKRLVLDSEVFKDVVVDAIADRFPLYPMPMCRTVIDCEIGIPIDRAVSWATEAIPDIANYVFLEEQFSTVLQGLIDSQLHERFDDFSVRLRQYFNYFDRLQEFLYLALKRDIRPTVNPSGQELLAWCHGDQTDYLTDTGTGLLEGMSSFIGNRHRFSEVEIDRNEFLRVISAHHSTPAVDFRQLPKPMPKEIGYLLKLIEKSNGYLDIRI